MARPADLMAEIDARFGADPSDGVEFTGSWHQERYLNDLADSLIASARRRADIAVWLLGRVPEWNLFLMGMSEAHSAGHVMAHGLDPAHLLGSHPTAAVARARFIEVYRAIDDTVARIAAALPEGAALGLESSKGMVPNRDDVASCVLLPELLHRLATGHSYLHEPTHRAWRRKGFPAVAPDRARGSTERMNWLVADGRAAEVRRWLRAVVPPQAVSLVRKVRGSALAARLLAKTPHGPVDAVDGRSYEPKGPAVRMPDGSEPTQAGEVDWQQSMAYQSRWPSMPWFALPSFSQGHIRINLVGRESRGIVALDDYARTCDELEANLRAATDPRTGESVVADVQRLRADDPMAFDGPGADLVVNWRAPIDAVDHPTAGTIGPFPFPRSGSHTSDGFLLLAGPGVVHDTLEVRPVLDVGPTLRALLGWSTRQGLDGTTIEELTEPVPR